MIAFLNWKHTEPSEGEHTVFVGFHDYRYDVVHPTIVGDDFNDDAGQVNLEFLATIPRCSICFRVDLPQLPYRHTRGDRLQSAPN